MASGVFVGKLNRAGLRRWLKERTERDFRDPRYPSVRLRAMASRQRASVFLVVNEDNQTKWKKQGTWPDMSIDCFLDELPEALAKRALGGDWTMGRFEVVTDLLLWFVDHVIGNTTLSKSWRRNVRSVVGKHLVPRLGDLPLAELSFLDVDKQLVQTMLADGYSAGYVAEVVSKLKAAFSKAAELRVVGTNPLADYQAKLSLKVAANDTRLFESELGALFERLSAALMPVAMLFTLMMMFGTRIGETRLARWDHFSGGMWIIPASNTKSKQEHRLPLTAAAWALIEHYRKWQLQHVGKRAFLFAGVDGPISIRTAQKWSEEIRFKDFTSHDLRKLFRTIIADMGVDTVIGERLVNHSLPVLLRTYVLSTLNTGMKQAIEQYHEYLIAHGFNKVAPEIIPRSLADLGNAETKMASGWL
ncbi:tyrosine-type recombinase/integrase [Shewanella sp. C32]|uniref:Tyrosine-type recombinase/integrase n=1 Tax=Shewanella electrica TaxID=515560 RepID=A0ABT2FQA2_9GAMM|nr:tyrosine-type recombinase/integrase [Shewanella electrica]MCS4558523.1 tyrosine-type recombinase/integrase [Shewanella electrica]